VEVEKLEDLIGNQQLNSHRFGTHVTNTILKLLKRSDDRLTSQLRDIFDGLTEREKALLLKNSFKTKRLIRLRETIAEMGADLTKITSSVLADEGRPFAAFEVRRAADVAYASGVADLGVTITQSQAYAAAMSRPMNGTHIRDHIRDRSKAHVRLISAAINEGFVLGESTDKIMNRIRGTVAQKRKDGLLYKRDGSIERLVVRSALNHISNTASMVAFEQIGVEEYYLSPVFDGRTGDICRSLNASGIDYYKLGKGPVPPLHAGGCRTIVLARTRSSGKRSRKPFVSDTRPVGKIPKDQRKGKVGITNAPSFDAWLRRQPVSIQKDWLGPTRYKLFKDGMKLDKFADPVKGKSFNLAQIESKNKAAFDRIAD